MWLGPNAIVRPRDTQDNGYRENTLRHPHPSPSRQQRPA